MVVQEMVYHFKLEAKRNDSTAAPDMPLAQVITWLNKGMMSLLLKRYGPHNAYRQTLESIQKRIDEWQRLTVPHELLLMKRQTDSRYTCDLTKTKKPYLFLMRCAFIGSDPECPDVRLTSRYAAADDLETDLDNPHKNPNFEWREVLHRLAEDKIIAYTAPSFSLSKADIDYLRYPKPIDLVGYTHFNKTASQTTECELPDFLHADIVTEAVYLYKLRTNHPDQQAAALAASTTE